MRHFLIPIIFGLLGVVLFLCSISTEHFPESLSPLTMPGLMLTYALIHGTEGAAGWLALAAGCAVQFLMFAMAGMLVATARRVIFPAGSRRGQGAAGGG